MPMSLEEAMALVQRIGGVVTNPLGPPRDGGGGGGGGFGDDPFTDSDTSTPQFREGADGYTYVYNPGTGRWDNTGLQSSLPAGSGSSGSSVPYDTVSYGGSLYRFNRATGELEEVASSGASDPWSDPEFLYGVQQDALARSDSKDARERADAQFRSQMAIEAALAQYNAGVSVATLQANLAMQAQSLEQQARVAQQEGREGTAGIIMQYAQMLRDAEQDPFRLGEYMVNLQRQADKGGSGGLPLSDLIGEGFRIEPQLPDPFADPRWDELLDAMYQYGTAPPPDIDIPDINLPELDIQSILDQMGQGQGQGGFDAEQAILDAYGSNPALANAYFSATEEARQNLAGAGGGQQAPERNEYGDFLREVSGYTDAERQALADIASGKVKVSSSSGSSSGSSKPKPTSTKPKKSTTGQTYDFSKLKLPGLAEGGQMVTDGPMAMVDLKTGEPKVILGEGGEPEVVDITPMHKITPWRDSVMMAANGGRIGILPRLSPGALRGIRTRGAPAFRGADPRSVYGGARTLRRTQGAIGNRPAEVPNDFPFPKREQSGGTGAEGLGTRPTEVPNDFPTQPRVPEPYGDFPYGDVTGDDDVNSGDQLYMARLANLVLRRAYDPKFDLNNDGRINSGDQLLAAKRGRRPVLMAEGGQVAVTPAKASAIAVGRMLRPLSFVPRDVVETLERGDVLRPGQAIDDWMRKVSPITRNLIRSATQQGGIPLEDWDFERGKYNVPGMQLAVAR